MSSGITRISVNNKKQFYCEENLVFGIGALKSFDYKEHWLQRTWFYQLNDRVLENPSF